MRNPILKKIKQLLRLDRAIRLVWKAAPGWATANLVLQIIQGILPLAALYLIKMIVDAVTLSLTQPDKSMALKQIVLLIILAAGVALLMALAQLLANMANEALSLTVTDHVYDILHAKSVEVDLEYYENPQYFDTLHRAQAEGPYRPTSIVYQLFLLLQNGVSLIAMAGLLFFLHWSVALILFAAVIPGMLVRLKFANIMFDWNRDHTPLERQAVYFNWVLTGDQHAKEIRLFGLGDLLIERFSKLHSLLRNKKLELARKRSKADFLAEATATLAVFGSFIFIVFKTVYGHITIGDMVMFFQAFQRGFGSMRSLLGNLASLYENNLFLSNLFEFLAIKQKVLEPVSPEPFPRPMQQGIVFNNVSFHYPATKRQVLQDISLEISPGDVVALVGRNGCGKTTLAKLLCRLYDPDQGTITIDNIDIRNFETGVLRREMGVLLQDFAQYYLSARENIWFGDITTPPDQERIISAARHAGVDSLIKGLSHGYDTMLGKWFEDGEELSRGEWQKIALARAFLRKSQMILLDEPASSLDPRAEFEIFQKFKELAQGKTAIFISHRLSTVKMADRIFVMDKGKIVESGTYEDLMQKKGSFAHLFGTHC